MKRPSLAALLMALPLLAYSQVLSPVFPPSPRMAALGGPHAASAQGVDAIFENPAGFAVEGRIINVSSIVPQVTGPVFDIANLLMGEPDALKDNIPTILDDSGRLFIQMDLAGPLSFSYVGSGLGFGLYNRTVATINASSLLNASLTIQEDLLLAGGYAHRFVLAGTHIVDVGIMPKGFMRSLVSIDGTIEDLLDITTAVSDPTTLMSDYDFTVVSGIGFDAGARWNPTSSFALGLVVRDAYSPAIVSGYSSMNDFLDGSSSPETEYQLIPADLSIGVAYYAPFAAFRRLGIDLSVYLDYRDILNLLAPVPRNPILNVGLGTELILLDIISFRAGINDALPAAGFGLDLSFFTLSLAMYGSELGLEPGKRPAYNVVFALDFRY